MTLIVSKVLYVPPEVSARLVQGSVSDGQSF